MSSNRASRRSNRSTGSASTPVRNVVVETSPRSQVSEISTPTTHRGDDGALATLAVLASTRVSAIPPRRRPPTRASTALEEEEEYDRRCYAENPGAEDSEDEDDEVADAAFQSQMERNQHEEDNLVALDDDAEIIGSNTTISLEGAPEGWFPPGAPEDWTPNAPRIARGEPASFADVDNPGGWSSFTFQPKFDKASKYKYHALPTGATPVKPDSEGKRICGDYEFFYDGWKKPTVDADGDPWPAFRHGASKENMFPESRKGSLDADVLKSLGLTKERMLEADGSPDALFFWQLLLPIHNVKDIPADPRSPFYTEVALWSNTYACRDLRLGMGYGHNFDTVQVPELVRWDGVILMDGVRGGSNGAILRRFDTSREDNTSFDKNISAAMTKTRFLEIKRVYKLNDNKDGVKRGEEGYNPAYKYDYIWKTLVHNVNALTLRAGLDQCADETTFAYQGFGEKGLYGNIHGKPKVKRGAQIVLSSDVDRLRPRAYVHRHKLHEKVFRYQGCNEAYLLMKEIEDLVVTPTAPRGIFSEKPHFTFDNFFSGDEIFSYASENDWGLTMTCRRDRLPKGIEHKYVHKDKCGVTDRSRAAGYEHPIFAIKSSGDSAIQLSTFQSTGATNFVSVNAVNANTLYVHQKSRGRGIYRRSWGIEMNESRHLYLGSYGIIDTVDHYIKNCNIFYRSWKYWHSGMNHGKGATAIISYDIYLECCEGVLDPAWKVDKPVDFHRWREKLSFQKLRYDPAHCKYPGDEKLRLATRTPKKNRENRYNSPQRSTTAGSQTSSGTSSRSGVSMELMKEEWKHGRLCGFLKDIRKHIISVKPIPNKNSRVCAVCGDDCYHHCTLCNMPMHFKTAPKALTDTDAPCFFLYHDTGCLGLAKSDCKKVGKLKRSWTMATPSAMEEHYVDMKRIHTSILETTPAATLNNGASMFVARLRDNITTTSNSDKENEAEADDDSVDRNRVL